MTNQLQKLNKQKLLFTLRSVTKIYQNEKTQNMLNQLITYLKKLIKYQNYMMI